MKAARKTLLALCVLVGFASRTSAQTASPQTFDEKVYAIARIGRFPSDPGTFAGLSPRDKADVVACRDVLMGLLKSLQTGGNALRYLTPDFASQYRTSADVLASMVTLETSLLAAGVSGVAFVEDRTGIQLRFVLLAHSEGRLVAWEESAVLRKTGSRWRVAGFD